MKGVSQRSIVFVLGRFAIGGVEKVTVSLANEFVRRGWQVGVVAFEVLPANMLGDFDPQVEILCLTFPVWSVANYRLLSKFIRTRKVDCVINQWAAPFAVSAFIKLASPGKVKLLAVHHTEPGRSKVLQDASSKVRRVFVRMALGLNMHLTYLLCDRYVVLSRSFISIFRRFAKVSNVRKLVAIPNPVELQEVPNVEKENAILYVGRLEIAEKRVDRLIEVWRKMADRFPNWRLDIVGDGNARKNLEELAGNLPRVTFHGFQKPEGFYAKSKILLLTSDFEGFGLVLVEAMIAGCVPVCLDSYASARDIVLPEYGRVLPMPFGAEQFADELSSLVRNPLKLAEMGRLAKKASGRYSVPRIADEYEGLLGGINI